MNPRKSPAAPAPFRFAAVGLAIALGACAPVASLRTVKPVFAPGVSPDENLHRAAEAIADGHKHESRQPLAAIADYLGAAQSAATTLASRPQDTEALRSYDFALSRIFSVVRERKVPAWTKPLEVTSARGTFHLLPLHDARHAWQPADYDLVPADTVKAGGTGFRNAARVEGLGAPLVAIRKKPLPDAAQKFLLSSKAYYADTAVARFEKGTCDISLIDPLLTTSVSLNGQTFPLAADYHTSTAMLLADERLDRLGMSRVLNPGKYEETARISRLQPYDAKKIPILFIHGLNSTPETWMPMFNTLRADPEIRRHYQFWFYSYPTGYPYFYPAMVLRHELDKLKTAYPETRRIVVVGHSMGSLIARLLITDSGDKIWKVYFKTPPARTPLQKQDQEFMVDGLIFQHRPEVAREIFICGPHRGSELANHWLAGTFSRLVHLPTKMDAMSRRISPLVIENADHKHVWQMPTSIATLTPKSRFVKAVNTIPPVPGVPYHQIMGDRGRGDTLKSSDGIVPYWSSHLDGAKSELIVPSGHSGHADPQAIAEVQRILKLHLRETNADAEGQN